MKKFLSVVLTLMMVFSVFTTVSAATVKDYINSGTFVDKTESASPFFQIGTIDPIDDDVSPALFDNVTEDGTSA